MRQNRLESQPNTNKKIKATKKRKHKQKDLRKVLEHITKTKSRIIDSACSIIYTKLFAKQIILKLLC